jgi:hypothetical protein
LSAFISFFSFSFYISSFLCYFFPH